MDVGLGRCPGTTSKSGGSCIEQQPDLRLRCGLEGLPALNALGVIALKRAEDRAECRLTATIAAVNQRVTTIFTAADTRRLKSTDILNRLYRKRVGSGKNVSVRADLAVGGFMSKKK